MCFGETIWAEEYLKRTDVDNYFLQPLQRDCKSKVWQFVSCLCECYNWQFSGELWVRVKTNCCWINHKAPYYLVHLTYLSSWKTDCSFLYTCRYFIQNFWSYQHQHITKNIVTTVTTLLPILKYYASIPWGGHKKQTIAIIIGLTRALLKCCF